MQEIITPIQAPRRPMKGVATGIPEAIKIRSLDHVRPALVLDRLHLNSGQLIHEMDKQGRHHRITFERPVDGQRACGKWVSVHHGTLYVHLGRTYIAYNRELFYGRIMDADILASKLKIPVQRLALKGR